MDGLMLVVEVVGGAGIFVTWYDFTNVALVTIICIVFLIDIQYKQSILASQSWLM